MFPFISTPPPSSTPPTPLTPPTPFTQKTDLEAELASLDKKKGKKSLAGGDGAGGVGGGAEGGVGGAMRLPQCATLALSSMFAFLKEAAALHPELCKKPIEMILRFIDSLGPQALLGETVKGEKGKGKGDAHKQQHKAAGTAVGGDTEQVLTDLADLLQHHVRLQFTQAASDQAAAAAAIVAGNPDVVIDDGGVSLSAVVALALTLGDARRWLDALLLLLDVVDSEGASSAAGGEGRGGKTFPLPKALYALNRVAKGVFIAPELVLAAGAGATSFHIGSGDGGASSSSSSSGSLADVSLAGPGCVACAGTRLFVWRADGLFQIALGDGVDVRTGERFEAGHVHGRSSKLNDLFGPGCWMGVEAESSLGVGGGSEEGTGGDPTGSTGSAVIRHRLLVSSPSTLGPSVLAVVDVGDVGGAGGGVEVTMVGQREITVEATEGGEYQKAEEGGLRYFMDERGQLKALQSVLGGSSTGASGEGVMACRVVNVTTTAAGAAVISGGGGNGGNTDNELSPAQSASLVMAPAAEMCRVAVLGGDSGSWADGLSGAAAGAGAGGGSFWTPPLGMGQEQGDRTGGESKEGGDSTSLVVASHIGTPLAVAHATSSSAHGLTLLVSRVGALFYLGKAGLLGLDETCNTAVPRPLSSFPERVKNCVLTDTHVLVLTVAGGVWSCGQGESGALGLGKDKDVKVLTRVVIGDPDAPVAFIAARVGKSAAVTASGALYTWGRDTGAGELGWMSDMVKAKKLVRIKSRMKKSPHHVTAIADADESKAKDGAAPAAKDGWNKIAAVSLGASHTVVVTQNGMLWTAGSANKGQCGRPDDTVPNPCDWGDGDGDGGGDAVKSICAWGPVDMKAIGGGGGAPTVAQVVAGAAHTAFVDTTGAVWTCGDNAEEQLGRRLPDGDEAAAAAATSFERIPCFGKGTRATAIKVAVQGTGGAGGGSQRTLVLTAAGAVFYLGKRQGEGGAFGAAIDGAAIAAAAFGDEGDEGKGESKGESKGGGGGGDAGGSVHLLLDGSVLSALSPPDNTCGLTQVQDMFTEGGGGAGGETVSLVFQLPPPPPRWVHSMDVCTGGGLIALRSRHGASPEGDERETKEGGGEDGGRGGGQVVPHSSTWQIFDASRGAYIQSESAGPSSLDACVGGFACDPPNERCVGLSADGRTVTVYEMIPAGVAGGSHGNSGGGASNAADAADRLLWLCGVLPQPDMPVTTSTAALAMISTSSALLEKAGQGEQVVLPVKRRFQENSGGEGSGAARYSEPEDINRFKSFQSGWHCSAPPSHDSVCMTPSERIFVCGMGYFGQSGQTTKGKMLVHECEGGKPSGDAILEHEFEVDQTEKDKPEYVDFDAGQGVVLEADTKYHLCVEQNGGSFYYGDSGQVSVTSEGPSGVTFKFEDSSKPSNSGTSKSRGLIPGLRFSTIESGSGGGSGGDGGAGGAAPGSTSSSASPSSDDSAGGSGALADPSCGPIFLAPLCLGLGKEEMGAALRLMTWAHKTLLPRAVQGSQAARGSLDILATSAGLNACKMVALNAASLGARGWGSLLSSGDGESKDDGNAEEDGNGGAPRFDDDAEVARASYLHTLEVLLSSFVSSSRLSDISRGSVEDEDEALVVATAALQVQAGQVLLQLFPLLYPTWRLKLQRLQELTAPIILTSARAVKPGTYRLLVIVLDALNSTGLPSILASRAKWTASLSSSSSSGASGAYLATIEGLRKSEEGEGEERETKETKEGHGGAGEEEMGAAASSSSQPSMTVKGLVGDLLRLAIGDIETIFAALNDDSSSSSSSGSGSELTSTAGSPGGGGGSDMAEVQSAAGRMLVKMQEKIVSQVGAEAPEDDEGAEGGAMGQSTAGPCNVVKRFGSQMSGWGYSGSPDAVAFSSDTDIDVIGLVLFGSGSMDKEFTTKVRIHEGKDTSKDDDTVLVSTEFTFTAEDDDDKTAEVRFDAPIRCAAGDLFGVWMNYSSGGGDGYYGSSGKSKKDGDDGEVTFSFHSATGSNNGTDVGSGQCAGILYRLPPKRGAKGAKGGKGAAAAATATPAKAATAATAGKKKVESDHWTWDPDNKSDHMVCENENLRTKKSGGSTDGARGSRGFSRKEGGVHEWEIDWESGQGTNSVIGVCTDDCPMQLPKLCNMIGDSTEGWAWKASDGGCYYDKEKLSTIATYDRGDKLKMVLDMDKGTLAFEKNGDDQGIAFTGITGTVYPCWATTWHGGGINIIGCTSTFTKGRGAGDNAEGESDAEVDVQVSEIDSPCYCVLCCSGAREISPAP